MEARALAKQVRISPYKVRRILPLIRGKKVDEAMMILKYSPQKAAGIVSKVLQSAVANAEHNYGMDTDKLRVVKATADQGPRMKRFRPVSMGRAHPYQHRTSHVTIIVAER
ncbi:MAG: 50S ribosomal protein L22 [Aminobacterium colombiense]|jgi:large subunit ribosomal protein L22|uniref:Large ribosomal subunit protein uL22 n=1 Tax=Aminobacterium colombiense (strain DSM 12261 / ALA-1) TaxID=572547 RepID=D5EDY5_AMICL|nr:MULTISPECIES: 50S ribosomal protein L22 [Aminobacterium]MDD2378621.1 50S ribosomal protein L22 [Aminobacterium colombiense]ADE56767.1 ribosomal protein L22 [Aminobacterium colombiense DSM 12261]MDD3767640.1 50S ribosomal protein L22 [Aminobacterium colombiense]MDD4264924.1 50S ribosomal protein L22 [Aminobacterium colombiense]MDD4585513.1 50S ribosomal protein L22 [Aminobacterium colombiense]